MWHFQRIICIWICCVSCMFGTTQLSSSLVRAVPYEYFDDHEQSFYDLDSEQIQAKYDTRLLSQQMLQTQQQQEQQQQQHLENLKGFHAPTSERRPSHSKLNDAGVSFISTTATKLKHNDGHVLGMGTDLDDDDNNKNERNDWLEETATKAAALTTATITETLDELHLPRAASCFTNGQKFTHGQKVPRLDNCEVCLCMDGEIFCWWEICDKKPTKATIAYDENATPFEELSTTRVHLNPKTTYRTTLKPMKKPKINEDYKYDDDDSAEIREMQQEYEGLREQLMRNEADESQQHKTHHNQKMAKKKIYQQQEVEKHDKKPEEENKSKIKIKKKEEKQQENNHKQHKTNEQHHHAHNHNNNNNNNRNNNHDYGLSGSSSKILNFPENLPSVLYYDYKTEEHHQHQHQHREQHLKHQKQKQQQRLLLQQHEKELKQQQQQQQQNQQLQKNHVNLQHEYGQDFNTHRISTLSAVVAGIEETGRAEGQAKNDAQKGSKAGDGEQPYGRSGESSTTFKYFSNGNENIYADDMQTDSDILPEPPTNKPKYLTSITDATTTSAKTTGIPQLQFYRISTSMMATTDGTTTNRTTTTANTTAASTNSPPTASMLLKKKIASPWEYNQPARDKINNNNDNNGNGNTNSNDNKSKSFEDTIEADDQDDAFHRWLTSTETNNRNNFTLNDAIIGRDDDDDDDGDEGDDDDVGLDAVAGGSGLDGSNNDYNLDERNYENINWATDTGFATMLNAKAKADMRPLTIKAAATTTAINAFDMAETAAAAVEGEPPLFYENIPKPRYEQNFSENNSYSNNSNIINSNENNSNNNNNSPFSSRASENNNRNNNEMVRPTSGSRGVPSTSTTSNEDNNVASVVNIDIMLTASSAESKKQLQLQPQQTTMETTNQQHRQFQLQDFENSKKQIAHTQLKFMQPQLLISNTNDVVNNNPFNSIINDNTSNSSSNNNNTGMFKSERTTTRLQNVGVNLSSGSNSNGNKTNKNNFNSNSASSQSLSSSSDSFKFNRLTAMVPQPNATSAAATPPSLGTTVSPERQCNVMGTLYKIGDILPQDTGNCLQCICIDGSTSDDTPRVTCSPHNCPPLVLPDLFDATGY